MTEEDKKLLSTFEARLRHFMYLHDELTRENARLKQLLAEKDDEIKQVENSRKELEAMYTNLKMARTISIHDNDCLLYTSPSPRDSTSSRMPSSA